MRGGAVSDPYSQSEWVYIGIRAITNAITKVPLYALRGKDENPERVGGDWQRFFDSPNEILTRSEFWAATIAYLYTRRGAAWWLRGKNGELQKNEIPFEAWPFPAELAVACDAQERDIASITQHPEKYRLTVGDRQRYVDAREIVRFRFFNPSSPLNGFLVLDPIAAMVSFGYQSEQFGAAFFANNCDLGGWVKVPGAMTDAQIKELRKGFEDRHKGAVNAGKLGIFANGSEFVANPRSQKDMEYIEGMKYARDAVLATLGVPKAIVGVTDDLNYATHVGQERVFYQNTVFPLMSNFEDVMYSQITKPIDENIWPGFDLETISVLSSDLGEKIAQATQLVNLGYTVDQANARTGMKMPKAPAVIAENDPLLAALAKQTPDAATPAATAAPVAAVQDTAFNGAQVTSLVDVVSKVSEKTMPAEAAKQIILAGFPTVTEDQASKMVESAAAFDPPAEEPRFSVPYFKRGPVTITDRIGYVDEYIRSVVIPSERKLNAAMRRYLAALGLDQRKRLADWMKKNKLTGESLATFTKEDVDAILFQRERWDAALRASGSPSIEATIKGALKATADEVGGAFLPMSNPRVSELFGETVGILVKEVNDTTREKIRGHLLASTAKGETIQQAQMRLAPWVNENPARALLIARTETGMASSGARYVGLQEAEIEKHEWVTAGSGDIRETHEKAGGEVVEIGKRFSNGLLHPHEIGADPSEVCNCRCEALAV